MSLTQDTTAWTDKDDSNADLKPKQTMTHLILTEKQTSKNKSLLDFSSS